MTTETLAHALYLADLTWDGSRDKYLHMAQTVERTLDMPKKYEAIRDKMIAKGKSTAAAKTSAAKIFNATRKPSTAPVTRKSK